MRESKGEKLFYAINYVLLTLIAILCIYPLIYILSASFSSSSEVIGGNVILLPKGLTLESYQRVLSNSSIWLAYGNTIFYTVAGVAVSMVLDHSGGLFPVKEAADGKAVFRFFHLAYPVVSSRDNPHIFEYCQSAYAGFEMGHSDPLCAVCL